MDFKRTISEERTSLAMDRDSTLMSSTQFISAAIPFNNKLKNKTDEQLQAMYPVKYQMAIAVRDWLADNAVDLNTKHEEL